MEGLPVFNAEATLKYFDNLYSIPSEFEDAIRTISRNIDSEAEYNKNSLQSLRNLEISQFDEQPVQTFEFFILPLITRRYFIEKLPNNDKTITWKYTLNKGEKHITDTFVTAKLEVLKEYLNLISNLLGVITTLSEQVSEKHKQLLLKRNQCMSNLQSDYDLHLTNKKVKALAEQDKLFLSSTNDEYDYLNNKNMYLCQLYRFYRVLNMVSNG